MDTIHEIYETQVKPLSVADRLALMRLIMDDIADTAPRWVVDINDIWSDEDLNDLTTASLAYASSKILGEDDDAEAR